MVARDPADADALWVTEVWDSPESHRASLSAPSVRRAIERGRDLIAGFEQRFETQPVAGHGLAPSAQAAPTTSRACTCGFPNCPPSIRDRAVRFYTEKLGFRVAEDRPYQEGWRWILLEIPGAQTMLRLSPKTAGNRRMRRPSSSPSMTSTGGTREMKAKGVVFTQEPTPAFWNPQEVFAGVPGQRRQPGDDGFRNIPTPEKALSPGRDLPAGAGQWVEPMATNGRISTDGAHANERSARPTTGAHVQQPGAHPTAERPSNNNTKIRIPKEFASRGGTVNPRSLLERHLRAVERAAADPQVLSPGAPRAVAALCLGRRMAEPAR